MYRPGLFFCAGSDTLDRKAPGLHVRIALSIAISFLNVVPATAGEAWNCQNSVECQAPQGCLVGRNYEITKRGLMQFGGQYGGPFYKIIRNDKQALEAILSKDRQWQLIIIDKETMRFSTVANRSNGTFEEQHGTCRLLRGN